MLHTVPRRRAAAASAALALLALLGAPAVAAGPEDPAPWRLSAGGQCQFPAATHPGTPWALQRVMLDQLWSQSTGKGVVVAVIDSGVDAANPQLTASISEIGQDDFAPETKGRIDENGHGTMAAGIIAARPDAKTGFVGLAYDAKILPIRQNGGTDSQKGNVATLAAAIRFAVASGATVINISQETSGPEGTAPGPDLERAIRDAIDKSNVVVVAAAGNSGDKENFDTYPAKYEGVLAVGASDRNNNRTGFSQNKPYVGVLAPGVDIWSTVPKGGHCSQDGTSFAAPYVSAVAALIRSAHPNWSARQVIAVIEQTAQRGQAGSVPGSGWGVVDPLKAVSFAGTPGNAPVETLVRPAVAPPVRVDPLMSGPTRAERDRKTGTVVVAAGFAVVLLLTSGAVVLRDARGRSRA
ncbi:type VII secretion-associated serine protease mycosin [Yinghuangia soli]|uniref:Type VII secretion-associated serine protease mycosin n=1 Tax=Yinghuangia soli TaxID=2908204 RepID=A0AA41QAC8_9ACTN|nr:type VII secretion-associated serine protease mycosin [Yinghuangia soli]MCF2533661.1 type VII secretion-associated serine protease mycosin [Yinghuangia soli]